MLTFTVLGTTEQVQAFATTALDRSIVSIVSMSDESISFMPIHEIDDIIFDQVCSYHVDHNLIASFRSTK